MVGYIRDFLRVWLLLSVMGIAGCGCQPGLTPVSTTGSGGSGGAGGSGGDAPLPCGVDCSAFPTLPCMVAVCNLGQELGPLNTCVVVPAPKGTVCDDGLFCTTHDACDNGTCKGGDPNQCGIASKDCNSIICFEETQSCDVLPVNDGATCTPTDLCLVDGTCHVGDCIGGEPKDCTFSPLNECNTVACDPATGKCKGTPDPTKDNEPCVLTGDLCSVNRTCQNGQCAGGTPKDCSDLDSGCLLGECDASSGICGPVPAPIGTVCTDGIPECYVGACDEKATCQPSAGPNGSSCNDHNSCTGADTCLTGVCAGSAIAGCTLYLNEGFEVCPNGWTFGGDWQCGAPTNVGPPAAHSGSNVIGTKINGFYSINQSFSTTVATSPSIKLTNATNPMLSFWAWVHTEGGTFDGWNMQVSTDGGQNFSDLTPLAPPYNLTIAGKPAWGGNHAGDGWQNYTADLTAYVGQQINLRFAFQSDGATVFPGVYIDDIVVAEPLQIPLYIDTPSPLTDIYLGMDYVKQITKVGGTSNVVWSLDNALGVNADWLTIDPASGLLTSSMPAPMVGNVSVTVHVQEVAFPSNFAEKTFTFKVKHDTYYTSFESCPNGWTLTGDWECGVPTKVGATPYVGTQCLVTKLDTNYSDLQTYATNGAVSPDIDLTGAQNLILTFRMWVDTEGSTYDGFNLKVSPDGGMNYQILSAVTPAYLYTIGGEAAWGGHQFGLGWQFVQADLSAYAGQTIRLKFSMRSDSSQNFAGVYIDDLFVD